MKKTGTRKEKKVVYNNHARDVAQLGSALPWGGRGHGFKSHRSDHLELKIPPLANEGFLFWSAFIETSRFMVSVNFIPSEPIRMGSD